MGMPPVPVLPPAARAALIFNEQTKLAATALNNLAVATFVAGVIAPAARVVYNAYEPIASGSAGSGLRVGVIAVFWLLAGVGLHLLARATLRRLV